MRTSSPPSAMPHSRSGYGTG